MTSKNAPSAFEYTNNRGIKMAKVLISPIGAARREDNPNREYKRTKYKFDGDDRVFETPFVSAALANYLKVDKIIFIGTAKSMWEEVYKYFTESANCEFDYDYWVEIGDLSENSTFDNSIINEAILQKTMDSVDKYLKTINPSASGGSLPLIIKYGLNERELWENFNLFMKLADILNDGDKLYLDITHSFRSIPLFMYLMMEFIQMLNHKEITLKGLYYGMFEAIAELGYTPVVDLKPLFDISQWIRGVYDFINYGNGYLISELICKQNVDDKNRINDISKKIKNISELININYLTDLQNQIKSLNKLSDGKHSRTGPIAYIFPLIEDFISKFSKIEKASEFQLELSKWYFENKRYGHGYICLVESILTKLCEIYGLDLNNIDSRQVMKKLVIKGPSWYKVEYLDRLSKKYKSINQIRNRIAHAAFYRDDNYSFITDIEQATKNYEDVKKLLESKEINELNSIIPIQEIYSK